MSQCNIDAIKVKNVLKTFAFDVEEYDISLTSGRKVIHTVVKRRPTVVVIPVTEDGYVYLIKQYRYLFGEILLEAVAGFVDKDESPLHAAKRELKEETGISAGSWEEVAKLDMAASVIKAQVHLYLCRDLELGTPEPEEDEDIEVVKMSLKDAIDKVLQGEITTSATATGLLLIDKILKR